MVLDYGEVVDACMCPGNRGECQRARGFFARRVSRCGEGLLPRVQ
jgi:hypothetical protein